MDEAVLLTSAAAILAVVSSQTGFSQHVRYAFPALPFLMVGAGKLVSERRPRQPGVKAAVSALLLWSAVSSLAVYPHSLSYFNEIAGGPGRGHDHLLDSNIDWGQDLFYLKDWLDRHPESQPLGLAYFNTVGPGFLNIAYEIPPSDPRSAGAGDLMGPARVGPHPGVYAVSVNFLRGLEFFIPDGTGGIHHVVPHEFAYLRMFRPVARAGYSISIYKITPEEADAARRRLGLAPLAGASP